MTLDALTQWWNLVYVVPAALAIFYLGIYVATGLGEGSGGDGDGDGDAAPEADAAESGDAADAGDSAGSHAGAHHVADGGETLPPAPRRVPLWRLGAGGLPLSFFLTLLFLVWGITGLGLNLILYPQLLAVGLAGQLPLISLPVAACLTLVLTAGLARLLGRALPLKESSARRRHELLGLCGQAIHAIDGRFGLAAVRDERGEFFQVACRTQAGAAPIPKDTVVRLISYNAALEQFEVVPESAQPREVSS